MATRDSAHIRAILQALSDDARLEAVRRLAEAPDDLPCGALHDGLPKSTASYHLATLRSCGLIEQYDRGGRRYNHLRREEIDRLAPGLLSSVLAAIGSSDER